MAAVEPHVDAERITAPQANRLLTLVVAPFVVAWLALGKLPRVIAMLFRWIGTALRPLTRAILAVIRVIGRALDWLDDLLEPVRRLVDRLLEPIQRGLAYLWQALRIVIRRLRELLRRPLEVLRFLLAIVGRILARGVLAVHIAWASVTWLLRAPFRILGVALEFVAIALWPAILGARALVVGAWRAATRPLVRAWRWAAARTIDPVRRAVARAWRRGLSLVQPAFAQAVAAIRRVVDEQRTAWRALRERFGR